MRVDPGHNEYAYGVFLYGVAAGIALACLIMVGMRCVAS